MTDEMTDIFDGESDREPDTESIVTNLTDISEDEDVPKHTTEEGLFHWLSVGKARLQKLTGKLRMPKRRGQYHLTKMNKEPSKRTQRRHRQAEREQKEREAREEEADPLKRKATQITDWFSRKGADHCNNPSLEVIMVSSDSEDSNFEIIDGCDDDETADPFGIEEIGSRSGDDSDGITVAAETRHPGVTVEEVEDEDDRAFEMSSAELGEEGLDDEPWDPSEEALPRPWTSPSPAPQSSGPSEPTGNFFTTADETFQPKSNTNGIKSKALALIPENAAVDQAIRAIQNILHPPRKTGRGYKTPKLNMVVRARLELMVGFLRLYRSQGYTGWTCAANTMAKAGGKGSWLSRKLREWSITFCKDNKALPTAEYGKHNSSVLEDEDIAGAIHLHLQSLGKWVSAKDIARYTATPEFQARLKVKRTITERTARRWMKRMGYRWQKEPKGMYSDGHEREDVMLYRQNVFLPRWREYEAATRWWKEDGTEDGDAKQRAFIAREDGKIVVIWRHDESTFYANDRRKLRWVHSSETAKPYAKGEGASLMVGDFVSADYGWLQSKNVGPDG